ncbi:MAG: hypothetical protein ABH879_06585 [archaeon]
MDDDDVPFRDAEEEETSEPEVYTEEGRESLVEDDEIEPWEEGFMEGACGKGHGAKCETCGKIFIGPEDVVETEIQGEVRRFCSQECADKYGQED